MVDFKFKLDSKPGKALLQLEKTLGMSMAKETYRFAEYAAGIVRETIKVEWLDKSTAGVSTGQLMRSYRPTMLMTSGKDVSVGIFSDLVYAGIHETGGTITAKNATNLAIPLTRKARRVSARQFPGNLKYVPVPGKNYKLLVEVRKRKNVAHYLLKRSVRIKPKRYLASSVKTINKVLPSYWRSSINGTVKKSFRGLKTR
tara:strand:+ start:180 stop:779 length:600 start_codon:yes stop_codon:yes gene_type:complete